MIIDIKVGEIINFTSENIIENLKLYIHGLIMLGDLELVWPLVQTRGLQPFPIRVWS